MRENSKVEKLPEGVDVPERLRTTTWASRDSLYTLCQVKKEEIEHEREKKWYLQRLRKPRLSKLNETEEEEEKKKKQVLKVSKKVINFMLYAF